MKEALHLEQCTRLPRESARDYALRFLRHNIINLHLKPGQMVSSAELAEVTGISRTPIREAMQELEKTGILEIFPQAGSRISYIDYGRIHESCFIRLALEKAVVSIACEGISLEDERALGDILEMQEKCFERNAPDEFLELDHQLHFRIYKAVNRSMTYQTVQDCLWHFNRIRRLSFDALSVKRLIDDHRELIAAILAQDKRRAKKIVQCHLTRYLDDEKVIRKKYPEYFLA